MTKISYLRKRLREEYNKRNLYEALAISDALLDEHLNCQMTDIARANDLYNTALIYDEMDKLEDAAVLYKESAIQICGCEARYMGIGSPFLELSEKNWLALALRINNLAGVLARMKNYYAANHHFVLAKAIYTRFNHPKAIDIVYNMGNLAAETNNLKEALDWHENVLETRNKEGASPEDIMHSLHSLAFIHEEKGEYQKAVSYAETALIHATGADCTSASIYLAGLYEACGQSDKALELYAQILDEMTKTGYRRCDYLTILNRRANLVYKTGDPVEAIQLHEEVLDMYHSLTSLDIDDLDDMLYTNCLKNIAELKSTIGETADADEYMLKSIMSHNINSGEHIGEIETDMWQRKNKFL